MTRRLLLAVALFVLGCTGGSVAESTAGLRVRQECATGPSILVFGDSLTSNGNWVGYLDGLLKGEGHILANEARSGRTWGWFATDPASPLHDVAGYLNGRHVDMVLALLGTNDCAHAPPENAPGIDACADAALVHADALLDGFRAASPGVRFLVGTMPAGSDSEAAFDHDYHGAITAAGWRRIHARMGVRYILHFAGHRDVAIVPTGLALDPWSSFPETNALHPLRVGYEQIGTAFYGAVREEASRCR